MTLRKASLWGVGIALFAAWPAQAASIQELYALSEAAKMKMMQGPSSCQTIFMKPEINGHQLYIGPLAKVEIIRADSRVNGGEIFCKSIDMGKKPFPVRFLIFHNDDYGGATQKPGALCHNATSGWKKDICEDTGNPETGENFPEKLMLFGKGNYPPIWYEGLSEQFYDSTYAHYQEQIAKRGGEYRAAEKGHPEIMLFTLDKWRTEFIWVSKDIKAPDGSPYAVSCVTPPTALDKLNYSEMANCWAAYTVNDDITVKYKFSSIVDSVPKQAKIIDAHVRDMVQEWMTSAPPPEPEPEPEPEQKPALAPATPSAPGNDAPDAGAE